MSDIKWNLPAVTEGGFLRRRLEISELLDLEPTPENTKKLAEYLAQYVIGENPLEQVLDAPQTEYAGAIMVLLGYKNTVEPKKGESSVQP